MDDTNSLFMPHWTEQSPGDFACALSVQFAECVQVRLDELGWSRKRLAQELGCSQAAVTQALNGRNFSIRTAVRYARAVGAKCTVVLYDDGDPYNERGPVDPRIFQAVWDQAGRPRTGWDIDASTSLEVNDG